MNDDAEYQHMVAVERELIEIRVLLSELVRMEQEKRIVREAT